MTVHWHDTNAADYLAAYGVGVDAGIYLAVIRWRYNGGDVARAQAQYTDATLQSAVTLSQQLTGLLPGDTVEWYTYVNCHWGNPVVGGYTKTEAHRDYSIAADSTGPTVSSRSPADASSGTSPKTFSATVADAYGLESVALWIDGAQVDEDTGLDGDLSYNYSYSMTPLSVDDHTWYLVATDVNGNETTSATWTVTITNTAPTMPGVPYYSNAAGVGGVVRVRWTPATDYNGDAITYDLAVEYNGAAWATVDTGITAAEYYWTPTTAGSRAAAGAGLRRDRLQLVAHDRLLHRLRQQPARRADHRGAAPARRR